MNQTKSINVDVDITLKSTNVRTLDAVLYSQDTNAPRVVINVKKDSVAVTDVVTATLLLSSANYRGYVNDGLSVKLDGTIADGSVTFELPNELLSYQGYVRADLYLYWQDGANDAAQPFIFSVKKSTIDAQSSVLSYVYISDFEKEKLRVTQAADAAINTIDTNEVIAQFNKDKQEVANAKTDALATITNAPNELTSAIAETKAVISKRPDELNTAVEQATDTINQKVDSVNEQAAITSISQKVAEVETVKSTAISSINSQVDLSADVSQAKQSMATSVSDVQQTASTESDKITSLLPELESEVSTLKTDLPIIQSQIAEAKDEINNLATQEMINNIPSKKEISELSSSIEQNKVVKTSLIKKYMNTLKLIIPKNKMDYSLDGIVNEKVTSVLDVDSNDIANIYLDEDLFFKIGDEKSNGAIYSLGKRMVDQLDIDDTLTYSKNHLKTSRRSYGKTGWMVFCRETQFEPLLKDKKYSMMVVVVPKVIPVEMTSLEIRIAGAGTTGINNPAFPTAIINNPIVGKAYYFPTSDLSSLLSFSRDSGRLKISINSVDWSKPYGIDGYEFDMYISIHEGEKVYPYSPHISEIASRLPQIDLWGDSITESNGAFKWSDTLSDRLGIQYAVNNYGISGQSSGAIAYRQNSNTITITGGTIPAAAESATLTAKTKFGTLDNFKNSTVTGAINGITGKFTVIDTNTVSFTRTVAGDILEILEDTEVTNDYISHDDAITVIWVGKNDSWFARDTFVESTPEIIAGMVSKLTTDKFIIIGVTTSSNEVKGSELYNNITTFNKKIEEIYGNRYLDIRRILIDQGLNYANITATDADKTAIEGDTLPPSILFDTTHPNDLVKPLIAESILKKMNELGYVDLLF